MTGKSAASRAPAHPLSPASLSSLPVELLTQVAGYLDKLSAISLSLASRKFIAPCEPQIWRTIAVSVPPYHGGLLPFQPVAKGTKKEKKHPVMLEAEASAAEDKRRAALREKIKGLMMDVGRRRLGMVEAIKITPLPTANIALLHLLDTLSSHLQSLELCAPRPLSLSEKARPADNEVIDYQMSNSGLRFPALTHLRINKHACRFLEIVNLLCMAAPELIDLQVDADCETSIPTWDSGDNSMLLDFPSMPSRTRLRRLRYPYSARGREHEDNHPIIQLVRRSPLLQQADIRHPDGDTPEFLFDALGDLEDLRDLRLPITVFQFKEWRQYSARSIFLSLKRLALGCGIELCLLEDMPHHLPSLEAIYLESEDQHKPEFIARSDFPEPQSITSMVPEARTAYRTCPRLAKLYSYVSPFENIHLPLSEHLDYIETSEKTRIGYIRSLRHGNDELFHARFFTHLVEISDGLSPRRYGSELELFYTTPDGVERLKTFEMCTEAAFLETSDYQESLVPISVMQEMRRAAGAALGSWEGRGIEAGSKAWRVLTNWREGREEQDEEPDETANDSEASEGEEETDSDCLVLKRLTGTGGRTQEVEAGRASGGCGAVRAGQGESDTSNLNHACHTSHVQPFPP